MAKKKATSHKHLSRIEKAIDEVLQGEQADPLLKLLSKDDQALLHEALHELRMDPGVANAYMSDLWRLDYTRRPPSMKEFLEDPYWLGGIMNKSEESEGIFPKWKEVLIEDFDIDSRIHNLVVTGSLGIGKCHAAGTVVTLFDGTQKTVENVQVGDLLMGDDSTPRKVLSTSTGHGDLFRITPLRPKNSPSWVCNAEHILCLKGEKGQVIEIPLKDYLEKPVRYSKFKLYRVPLQFPAQPVDLDPYWLGLWLGDGVSYGPHLVIADSEKDELLPYHEQIAHTHGLEIMIAPGSGCSLYRAKTSLRTNPLTQKLKTYGIQRDPGLGSAKRIPDIFLKNSTEVRRQLLAGLLDTDGGKYCEGCYGISFCRKELAMDTLFLARSLGYSVGYKFRYVSPKAGAPKDCESHELTVSGAHDLPLRVKRKRSHGRGAGNRRSTSKTGFTVEPIGPGNYYGFTLDGNHRYLLEDFTVTHNTFCTVTILLYRIVLALLLRNPQAFFGLAKGSQIFYAILSVTRSVVQETAFGDVLNFMGNSPFFIEECHFNPNKKYANLRIPLGGNIFMTAGSQGWHIIGRNAMGVALDEGNFRLESNPDLKAYKLYDEVRTRIRNRFQKMAGFMPAISILSSSARDESSFTEKVVNDIEKSKDDDQRIYRYAVYRIKAHTLKLDKRWFKVAYGLKNVDPYILGGWYDKDGKPVGDGPHESPPSGSKVELVPGNYFTDFKRNVKTNLQSISGISTGGSFRFFGNTIDLERAVASGTSGGLVNPCTVVSIPLSEEDDQEIWNFLEAKTFLTKKLSQIMPKRDPGAYRYCHLDLATRTQAGLSICHAVGKQKVEGVAHLGGEVFDEYRIVVEYDFILSIIAGKQKPISINKVINFIYWLRDVCGFRFAVVTADSFQSALPLQMLEKHGFKVANLSVDKTKKPYEAWRSGFEESRIKMFSQSILMNEAENLVDTGDKVDHDENHTKDVCDGACGAYYSAITFKDSNTLKSAYGSTPGVFSSVDLMESEEPPITVVDLSKHNKPTRSFEA